MAIQVRGGIRRDRNTVEPFDGFVLGQTKPTALNTGPRVPEASLANYAGSFTNVTAGEKIQRLAITGTFKPQAANVKLTDCLILYGANPAGASTGTKNVDAVVRDWYGINATSTAATNLQVEYTRLRPSSPTVDSYGINGRNWDLYRCHITLVVDGINPAGDLGVAPEVQSWSARGSLIDDLRFYASDPRQTDGAHSDGCQAQGRTTGVHPTSGITGLVGCTIYGGRTSAILIQQQSGTYSTLVIDDNWLYGHPTLGATINIADGGTAIPGLRVRRNRISNTSRPGNYRLLVSAATFNDPTRVISGNVELETGTPINAANGG